MQAITGSIDVSMFNFTAPQNGVDGVTTADSAEFQDFRAMLASQIETAFNLESEETVELQENPDLQDLIGKLFPEGLPAETMEQFAGNPEALATSIEEAIQSLIASSDQISPAQVLSKIAEDLPALSKQSDQNLEMIVRGEAELLEEETVTQRVPVAVVNRDAANQFLDQSQNQAEQFVSELLAKTSESVSDGADLETFTIKLDDFKSLQSNLQRLNPVTQPNLAQSVVTQQFGAQAWGEEFASRVQWQVGKDIQEAQINLNPRELGPVEVKLNLNDDQAHVQFISHHSAVREAVEEAIPRLREMLEANGITLADANVSDQPHPESPHQDNQEQTQLADADTVGEEEGNDSQVSTARVANGLVDAYI